MFQIILVSRTCLFLRLLRSVFVCVCVCALCTPFMFFAWFFFFFGFLFWLFFYRYLVTDMRLSLWMHKVHYIICVYFITLKQHKYVSLGLTCIVCVCLVFHSFELGARALMFWVVRLYGLARGMKLPACIFLISSAQMCVCLCMWFKCLSSSVQVISYT